jgi:hypothetical protein
MFSVPLLWPAISSTRLTEEYFLIPAKWGKLKEEVLYCIVWTRHVFY